MSIWSYVNTNVDQFLNPFYQEYAEKMEVNAEYITIHFWKEYFLQWTEFSDPIDTDGCFIKSDPRAELLQQLLDENKKLKGQLKNYNNSSEYVFLNGNGHA